MEDQEFTTWPCRAKSLSRMLQAYIVGLFATLNSLDAHDLARQKNQARYRDICNSRLGALFLDLSRQVGQCHQRRQVRIRTRCGFGQGADSELTMPFAIAILQIARNRAPPVRGKGLSHLSF